MPAAALEVQGLSAGYGPTRVIEDISFSVPAGHRLAILGRNGMGKTTLLTTLAGLTCHISGAIHVGGHDISALPTSERALRGLGFVPQARWIFPSLTVEENLFAGLKGRARDAISESYELFPRLKERRGNLGSQLSGGEQQMLSVARTLLGQPSVVLLDEPLEGLAPIVCDELMKAFAALAGSTTFVLVEQRIRAALDFAEQAIVLERGRIAWSGASKELDANSDLIERLLGVSVL